MAKVLLWDGEKHPVEDLTMLGAKVYGGVQNRLRASSDDDLEEQMDLCIQALRSLNCPESVIEKLPVGRFQECLSAISEVQFGTGGGDEGNVGGGEPTH